MKKATSLFLLLACLGMALATDAERKLVLFPPTGFGMQLPSGFERAKIPSRPGVWVFTNAAGSQLSFIFATHPSRKGEKIDFRGFAALELRTNLLRQITFETTGFSHAELQRVGKTPKYDAQLSYQAAHTNDQVRLDESIASFAVQPKKSNKPLQATPQ